MSSRYFRYLLTHERASLAALESAAQSVDLPVSGFLAGTALFAHGSTIATNTLLEGKGARVGCLTTTGFRDSLEIRRGIRDNPFEHRIPYPPVLAPRFLRRPVRGRIDADGSEFEKLDSPMSRTRPRFRADGVEAVASAVQQLCR